MLLFAAQPLPLVIETCMLVDVAQPLFIFTSLVAWALALALCSSQAAALPADTAIQSATAPSNITLLFSIPTSLEMGYERPLNKKIEPPPGRMPSYSSNTEYIIRAPAT